MAATGIPTLLFTAALVVVAGFWLLVVAGVAEPGCFDRDVDLGAWGMGGVPVAVALSLLTVGAWLIGVGAVVLLETFGPGGVPGGLLRLVVPVGALLVAWRLTGLSVRPLRQGAREHSDAADESRATGAGCALGLSDRPHARPVAETRTAVAGRRLDSPTASHSPRTP